MKTLFVIVLMLVSSSVHAEEAKVWSDLEQAQFEACQSYFNFRDAEPQCEAIRKRLKAGYLVDDRDYHAYCDSADKLYEEVKANIETYKKLAHTKTLDVSKCPVSSQINN